MTFLQILGLVYVVSLLSYGLIYGISAKQWHNWEYKAIRPFLKVELLQGPDFSYIYGYTISKMTTRKWASIVFWGLVPGANTLIVSFDIVNVFIVCISRFFVCIYDKIVDFLSYFIEAIARLFNNLGKQSNVIKKD